MEVILVLIVALLAGFEGILDSFQFHQPIVACTLIGLVTGHPAEGIMLGGSLQLVALGWMNIGPAVAPDAALCSVASAILVCMKGVDMGVGISAAMALAVAGLGLTIIVRTITVGLIHFADASAEKGSVRGVEVALLTALLLQGLRVVIPAAFIIAVPVEMVQAALDAIPIWVTTGLSTAGGFIVAVGYAMVINMMATPKLWPFFFLGFALSALSALNLISMGIIGLCIAFVYLQLAPEFNSSGAQTASAGVAGDELDAIINDYE